MIDVETGVPGSKPISFAALMVKPSPQGSPGVATCVPGSKGKYYLRNIKCYKNYKICKLVLSY